jgi:hypothetical protein
MVYGNTMARAAGLLATAEMKDEKILPIPTPTQARPMVASPAPMSFAASTSIFLIPYPLLFLSQKIARLSP